MLYSGETYSVAHINTLIQLTGLPNPWYADWRGLHRRQHKTEERQENLVHTYHCVIIHQRKIPQQSESNLKPLDR